MNLSQQLTEILTAAREQLSLLTEAETSLKLAPHKWSKKEILGHLIDSASNNHQRFVRGQFQDNMIFLGYDQNAWVRAQHYQTRSWQNLLTLWFAYNQQISHVMHCVPEDIRLRSVSHHNLHQIAFKTVPENQTTCLEYFMIDYVAHLEHHLGQILPHYEKQLGPYENDFHVEE